MEHTMRVKSTKSRKIRLKCRRSLKETFLWKKSDEIVIKTDFGAKPCFFLQFHLTNLFLQCIINITF